MSKSVTSNKITIEQAKEIFDADPGSAFIYVKLANGNEGYIYIEVDPNDPRDNVFMFANVVGWAAGIREAITEVNYPDFLWNNFLKNANAILKVEVK